MTEKFQVELFLGELICHWPPTCSVVPRKENNEALIELGLTPKIRQDAIFALTYQDYINGPEVDRDRPGDIWEFGKQVEGAEIYIKLKLFTTKRGMRSAKCISFHKAVWPLTYPFK